MTITSLAKRIAGVNRLAVEKVEIGESEGGNFWLFMFGQPRETSASAGSARRNAKNTTEETEDGAGAPWISGTG